MAIPGPEKLVICNPRMVFASDSTICRPASQSPVALLPSNTTPALLASIVTLPWRMCGNSLAMKMVTGASGGKTAGSNVMVSPFCASSIAWRRVPGPLSAGVVTSRVLPWGVGVGGTAVAVGGVSVGVTGVGEIGGWVTGIQAVRMRAIPSKQNRCMNPRKNV